jgi:c-di-GMP-binding flagellar brake protein YcgR
MQATSGLYVRRQQDLAPRIAPDRRRYKRFPIPLLGRFMRANKQEFPCRLNDISLGGFSLMSPVAIEVGERIVAYFDHIGGVEGTVVRQFEGGFAVALMVTQHKREKLAAQIMWLINRHELKGAEDRRHERVAAANAMSLSSLKLGDGVSIQTKIIDVSLSGASLATEARPVIGSEVQLGKLRARVVRHHEQGIAVQFLDIQEPEALRRYFG